MAHTAVRGYFASNHFASNHFHAYMFSIPLIYPDPSAATLAAQEYPFPVSSTPGDFTADHTARSVFPRGAPANHAGVIDIAPATFLVGVKPQPSASGVSGSNSVALTTAIDGGVGDAFVTDIRNAAPKLNIRPHKAKNV